MIVQNCRKSGAGCESAGPITKRCVVFENPQEYSSALFIHICMWTEGHDRKI